MEKFEIRNLIRGKNPTAKKGLFICLQDKDQTFDCIGIKTPEGVTELPSEHQNMTLAEMKAAAADFEHLAVVTEIDRPANYPYKTIIGLDDCLALLKGRTKNTQK